MTAPPGITDHIAGWLASRRNDATRTTYEPVAHEWLMWLGPRGIDPMQATRRNGDDWRHHLETIHRPNGKTGLKPATVARKLATIASLYDYLIEEGLLKDPSGRLLEVSPMARVDRPSGNRRQGSTGFIETVDVNRLMTAAEAAGPRTHVAVGMLVKTAIRANELLTLDCSAIQVRGKKLTVTVKRKGGDNDVQPLTERLAHDVEALRDGRTEGPLLARDATGEDAAWTYSQLHTAVARVGRAAGLPGKITPHVLRVTWATTALGAGVSLDRVQDVMGHANPATTRLYDRGRDDLDRKLEAMDKVEAAFMKGSTE